MRYKGWGMIHETIGMRHEARGMRHEKCGMRNALGRRLVRKDMKCKGVGVRELGTKVRNVG